MGHNSVVSSHTKSTGIPWVDKLSTGPSDLGRHISHTNKASDDKKHKVVINR